MIAKEWLPRGGAKELRQTKSGREYLTRLQQHHALDLLQPAHPKFEKVYGARKKREKDIAYRQQKAAEAEWHELRERQTWHKKVY